MTKVELRSIFFREGKDSALVWPERPKECGYTRKMNAIASILHINNIHSKRELVSRFNEIREVLKKQLIFGDSEKENFDLLVRAVRVYSKTQALSIALGENERALFETTAPFPSQDDFSSVTVGSEEISSEEISDDSVRSTAILSPPLIEDVSFHHIVDSYDQLESAKAELSRRSGILMNLIEKEDASAVERLIIGRGDTALALWVEEHEERHRDAICADTLPAVLMVGKDVGSWRHNYTLAQRHAMLERKAIPYQAADFVFQATYMQNRHVNARHLYQANQCNLVHTNAPVLDAEIKVIESLEEGAFNAESPWKKTEYKYRARIQTPSGIKYIYTKKIDICSGLGQATNPLLMPVRLGNKTLSPPMEQEEFNRLSKFDPDRACSPLIDGNEYVLGQEESHSRGARFVIVYGGGGTAAACGRKAFHGDDWKGEDKTFKAENAKNRVLWIARNNFDKTGTGTLAIAALGGLERREGLTLLKLEDRGSKLHVVFSETILDKTVTRVFECDQLIYSTGQTDDHLHPLLKNISDPLRPLLADIEGQEVLVGATAGADVRLLGAAANAGITTQFDDGTWSFLRSTNVGGDVGPGSMPPTMAQLRFLKAMGEQRVHIVNLNIDHPLVIKKFLCKAGVPLIGVYKFIDNMLKAREAHKPRGFSIETTKMLIDNDHLHGYVELAGLASLKLHH